VEMRKSKAKSGRDDLAPHCQIGGACLDTVIPERKSELEGRVNPHGSGRVLTEVVNAVAVADPIRAVPVYLG